MGIVPDLGFPSQTAWFRIDSEQGLAGVEMFGRDDGKDLVTYAGGAETAKTGAIEKIKENGCWTTIAFINTEATEASLSLTAYNDAGNAGVTQTLTVGGHARAVHPANAFFSLDISQATHIAYTSDRNIVALSGLYLCGSAAINAEPTALNTTAPWTLTGPNGYSQSGMGDQTLSSLPVGSYTITWGNVTGWIKPSPDTKDLISGGPITFSGTYVQQSPNIEVTPSIVSFGYVPPGTYKDLTLTVKNIGGGVLTGTVTASLPFSVISGGAYNLGIDQSQQIIVRYTAPLEEGSDAGSLIFTGGGGITIQVKGTNKKVALPWLILLLGN